MIITRAHIKNDRNRKILVYVYGSNTGHIIREKTLEIVPSQAGLTKAEKWLKGEYKKVEFTHEGFEPGSLPPLVTNEEGKIVQEGSSTNEDPPRGAPEPDVELTLPMVDVETGEIGFKPYPARPNVPRPPRLIGRTPEEINQLVRQYTGQLQDQNLFHGPTGDMGRLQRDARRQVSDIEAEDLSEDQLRRRMDDIVLIRGEEFNLIDAAANREYQSVTSGEPQVPPSERDWASEAGELEGDDLDLPLQEKPPRVATVKKAVQLEGLSARSRRALESLTPKEAKSNRGIGGDHIKEPVPNFDKADTEQVIANKRYNSWIVLGRDRADPEDATRASGYGGKGNTQCGSIDLVVGRMSPTPREVDFNDEALYVDPIFNVKNSQFGRICDAARIYISQKSDVDTNFKLAKGRVGVANERSCVAMKADGIRILAREGIKLITTADNMNSQGGNRTTITGVDIIAGNDDDNLQPMVLGNNLVDALVTMEDIVSSVVGSLQSVINDVAMLEFQMATHFHISPFFGVPTSHSPSAMPTSIGSMVKLVSVDTFSTAAQKWNLVGFKTKYLMPGSPFAIKSKYNHVN